MPSRKRSKSPSWYRSHAIALAKAIARSKGFCEMCGATKDEKQLHGAHIFPEPYAQVAANPLNIVCLCAAHHKLAKDSWHQSPVHGVRWLQKAYPGRIEQIEAIIIKNEKVDWKAAYEHLLGGDGA